MRGVPPCCCDSFTAPGAPGARGDGLVVVLAGAAAGVRRGPQAVGHRGAVRGSRRAVGLASEGRGKAAARNGEMPG
jgi:hypothetical protein